MILLSSRVKLTVSTVELRHTGQQPIIAKTITDSNGEFFLPEVPTGAYSLAAKPPTSYRVALFSTAVRGSIEQRKQKSNREIVLALGWLFSGCHGGYAAVRSKGK